MKREKINFKMLMIFATTLFMCTSTSNILTITVKAPPSEPVVDGVINPGEYNAGRHIVLEGPWDSPSSPYDGPLDGYLYWDNQYLWIAVNEPVPEWGGGGSFIEFMWDAGVHGTMPYYHAWVLFSDGNWQYVRCGKPSGSWGWAADPFPGHSWWATGTATEFKIDYTDYGTQPGDTIKLIVDSADRSASSLTFGNCQIWPYVDPTNPDYYPSETPASVATWGDVTLGVAGPPFADAGGPYSGTTGTSIPLDGTGSFDFGGTIVSYEWDLDYDGFYDDATGSTTSHSWVSDGVYTISLKVTDNDGFSDTDDATVNIGGPSHIVDGVIGSGEYDGGMAVQLVGRPPDDTWTCDAYIDWDSQYLYVGVDEPVGSYTEFAFDAGPHRSVLDVFTLFSGGGTNHQIATKVPLSGWSNDPYSFTAISGAATEFKIDYTDFGITLGDTIKMCIERGPSSPNAYWPAGGKLWDGPGRTPDASTWGDVTLTGGTPPPPPPPPETKMHFPQTPDPNGWDIMATWPFVVADDFLCTESGYIKDIHFWGSWFLDEVGEIEGFHISIHENIPADCGTPYSRPGELLWEQDVSRFSIAPMEPSRQGWYDPWCMMIEHPNHDQWFKYEIDFLEPWFVQVEGTIYWVDISAYTLGGMWGWKTSLDHWEDAATYAIDYPMIWGLLLDPRTEDPIDMAFYITGEPVPLIPPVACANGPYEDGDCDTDYTICFDGTGSYDPDGTIVQYDWNFGDGTGCYPDIGPTPCHTYSQPGEYTVTLVVTDNDGLTDTATSSVKIYAVVADVNGPYEDLDCNKDYTINFDGSASKGYMTPLTYEWDFGDGTGWHTGIGATPSYTYSNVGCYTVTLRVTEASCYGCTDTDTTTVKICGVIADAGGPYIQFDDPVVFFDGSGSDKPCECGCESILQYLWDFGDGTISTEENPVHTYAGPEHYTVTLTVKFCCIGRFCTNTTTTYVEIIYPVKANANGDYEGVIGTTIEFTGEGYDGTPPYEYYWYFGDGVYIDIQNPSHTYDAEGEYHGYLKVTDDKGEYDIDEFDVVVFSAATVVADIGGYYIGEIDENILLTGSAMGGLQPYTFSWDLDNDGQYDDALEATVQKSWSASGTYTISLKVTDRNGMSDTDTTQVSIASNAPFTPEKPNGITSGAAGKEYTYSTKAVDPNNDKVYYKWNLGDEETEWIGPFNSGETVEITHVWGEQGSYIIKVKAKDISGEESDWSEPLSVSMPKTKKYIDMPFLQFLFQLIQQFPFLTRLLQL